MLLACFCAAWLSVACPGGCNSRGNCISMAALSLLGPDVTSPDLAGDGHGVIYQNWEAQTMYTCSCFSGYDGLDCSTGGMGWREG